MQILHTADVHLKADAPHTVAALECILAEATDRAVDLVTIGGDLFDADTDAEALRPTLRTLFQDNPFDIVAIPGNHDEHVYRNNLRFGDDIEVLVSKPVSTKRFADVELVGVPFTTTMDEKLYETLTATRSSDRTRLLLLHCTLDIGFHSTDVGAAEGHYFPVTKATLAEFDFDYILAGHIHSTDREIPLENGGTFIYPGSPVSHTSREIGKRTATLLDTATQTVTSLPLETFYYDEFSATVRPGHEDQVLSDIETWVADRVDNDCELSIRVDGFVDRGERTFWEDLQAAADPVEPIDRTKTVEEVLTHPLYRRFAEKVVDRDDVSDIERVETHVLGVMADLLTTNRIHAR